MEDDVELERIRQSYEKGEMLTGELKKICIKHLQDYVAGFQERRKKVTEEIRKEFMSVRGLTWGGNPNPVAETKTNEKENDKTGKPNGILKG